MPGERPERSLHLRRPAVVVVAQPHELVRPRDGQPLQHRRLYEGEDGDVGAEAEGQSQDGDDAEAGTMRKAARADPKIVEEGQYRHRLL